MEENIKVLEKFVNQYNTDEDLFCFVNYNVIQAIEHLINKVKSQEKQIKLMKSINISENFIEKSKVREKIEELEKDYKEYENSNEWEIFDETKYAYELLQELLEEGDK